MPLGEFRAIGKVMFEQNAPSLGMLAYEADIAFGESSDRSFGFVVQLDIQAGLVDVFAKYVDLKARMDLMDRYHVTCDEVGGEARLEEAFHKLDENYRAVHEIINGRR